MGGSYITVAETTKYRWTVYENHTGKYRVYDLRVFRKEDDEIIEMRTNDSWGDAWGDESFREFDDAFDELEAESGSKYLFSALSKEQLTLVELYERMKKAEEELARYKIMNQDFEALFKQMYEIRRKMEYV